VEDHVIELERVDLAAIKSAEALTNVLLQDSQLLPVVLEHDLSISLSARSLLVGCGIAISPARGHANLPTSTREIAEYGARVGAELRSSASAGCLLMCLLSERSGTTISTVSSTEAEKEWLHSLSDPDAAAPMHPAWQEWLHDLYLQSGPLDRERVERMAEVELLTRAQQAGTLVAADVLATLGRPVAITSALHFERVRLVVDGEIANGAGLMSFDPTELLVEVADAAQEMIMDDSTVWPECPQHDAGLHPELVDGEAVWVCRSGAHTVARIGRLGKTVPPSAKAARRVERRRKRS
jgi:hypothetical protein